MKFSSVFFKGASALLVISLAGIGGATWAASQDNGPNGPEGPDVGQSYAVNTSIPRERHFVPVTACRAVDTRIAGGILAAGTSRGFDIFGSNLSAQGGSDEGCDVPSYADTVAMNLISTQPTGTGFLRGKAQNLSIVSPTAPTATLLSFATGPNRSNEVPVQLCRPVLGFACSGSDEIRLWAYQSSTHVVVDVLGYYVTPVYATVEGDADTPTLLRGNGVTSVSRLGQGWYSVIVDRDLRGCAIHATAGASGEEFATNNDYANVWTVSATEIQVVTWDAGADTTESADFSVSATC
jgi:hypothetical protein